MDFDKKLFKNKTYSDLLTEIYDNSKRKERRIDDLIDELSEMITNRGDATVIVPLIASYMTLSIRNDEKLLTLAAILQKAMTVAKKSDSEDLGDVLSEKDKEAILQALNGEKPTKK